MEERDPDFVRKAVAIIELELHPPDDGPTFCVDEKTGIGVRRPAAPSQPAAPEAGTTYTSPVVRPTPFTPARLKELLIWYVPSS